MNNVDDDANEKPAASNTATNRLILRSEDILSGTKEVIIMHRGEEYRLRETRNGKLILGK